jgi:CAAX prenyl protease-like protein
LAEIGDPAWAYVFLLIRFTGLVLIVPIMEEFFLRGFVLRFIIDPDDWFKVPFGTATNFVVLAGTAVPLLMHPGEVLASIVWFSGITWLMIRTRNIWDCIAAHAVTNLLMGLWVVFSGQWWLM